MLPADIDRIVTVADPRLRPDGQQVVVAVTRIDAAANAYRRALWLGPTGGELIPLTDPDGADRDVAWSPDGTRLAFCRSRSGRPARHQLCVLPAAGPGERVVLAEGPEAYASLAWSPDGRRLAGTVRVRDARYEPDDEAARPPRRIDGLRSRVDGDGWTVDRRRQVFVVAADRTEPLRLLTSGPFEHSAVTWAADGGSLVAVAARHADWDLTVVADLYRVALTGDGEPALLTDTTRNLGHPACSPDGRFVAALGSSFVDGYRHPQVVVVDLGTGEVRTLAADLDRCWDPASGTRGPVWAPDSASVLATCDDRGAVPLWRVPVDGSAPEPVVGGARTVTGFDADSGVVAFTASAWSEPSELFVLDGGAARQATRAQAAFVTACPPLPAERFTVPSPAGDIDLDVWLVRPPHLADGERCPVLLTVHGGPMTQYGERWFDEVQLYASAGYLVVLTNPHGSTGSTEASVRAIRSPLAATDPGDGWGGVDVEDLLAALDAALEREPRADPERIGVIGGSYGGYIASWLVARTDRFTAACSERAVNNLLSLDLVSDLAGFFRLELGADPLTDEGRDELLRMSPITHARDIRTPLLILHAEGDLRCPVEQADQLYTTLRQLGREVEYWRFPEEGHELSRSGSPAHRRQRAEIILDFFERQLLAPATGGQGG